MEYSNLTNNSAALNHTISTPVHTDTPQQQHDDVIELISFLLKRVGLTTVCCFGIVGNLLNLAVLTHKRMRQKMQNLERSAHTGLVALAVSDLLFCVFALPSGVLQRRKVFFRADENLFPLYYDTYMKVPVLSTLIVCSSWLTVVMALARYLAVSRPIHARAWISNTGTVIAIVSVYVASVLLTLPQFWFYTVTQLGGGDANSTVKYYPASGPLTRPDSRFASLRFSYTVIHAVVGVIIPVCILAFCNICLIRSLRHSQQLQRECTASTRRRASSGHRITPTLIAIVILFLVLAVPAELYKFVHLFIEDSSSKLAANVTNFLQACNFAINFVLYCALNVNFRNTVKYLLMCRCCAKERSVFNGQMTTLMTDADTEAQIISST